MVEESKADADPEVSALENEEVSSELIPPGAAEQGPEEISLDPVETTEAASQTGEP